MKKILFLLFFVFLCGCSNHAMLEVNGEVRMPRTFSYDELMVLDNSSKIVFWHVLAASGCINGWARDVLVYGDIVKDINLSTAYADDVFLIVDNNHLDIVAPEFNISNVHKIEVIDYDYRQKY